MHVSDFIATKQFAHKVVTSDICAGTIIQSFLLIGA